MKELLTSGWFRTLPPTPVHAAVGNSGELDRDAALRK